MKVVISMNVSNFEILHFPRSFGFVNFVNFQFLCYIFVIVENKSSSLLLLRNNLQTDIRRETYFLPIVIDSAPRLAVPESGRGQSNAGTLLGRFQKTAISLNDRTPSRSVKQISPARYVSFISCISMHRHIIIPRRHTGRFHRHGNLFFFDLSRARDPLVR